MHWQTARYRIDLAFPLVMGIVNVTPDSFSDGGQHAGPTAALAHCEKLLAEGADILDIGGESTRPGATSPGVSEELARMLPALDAGVDIINDVRALSRPGALPLLAAHPAAGVCLMHMRGEPADMAHQANYRDVVTDVLDALAARLREALDAGIAPERVVLDPGIGFAKTAAQNLELLSRQRELLAAGRPLLLGWSRKGTLGQITGRPVGERLAASVAAAVLAVERGASIVRVHDVAATVDALKVWRAATAGQVESAAGATNAHKPAA
jgi:dihydropteroate synthase